MTLPQWGLAVPLPMRLTLPDVGAFQPQGRRGGSRPSHHSTPDRGGRDSVCSCICPLLMYLAPGSSWHSDRSEHQERDGEEGTHWSECKLGTAIMANGGCPDSGAISPVPNSLRLQILIHPKDFHEVPWTARSWRWQASALSHVVDLALPTGVCAPEELGLGGS